MCSSVRKCLALGFIIPICAMAVENDCAILRVSTQDGYANVRSTPQVVTGNIVGAMPDGMELKPRRTEKDWIKVETPLSGWIHRTQAKDCAFEDETSDASLRAVMRVAQRAAEGDRTSMSALLRLSRAMDGSLSEGYGEAVAELAGRHPKLLIDALSTECTEVRRSALELLQFGLGKGPSAERQRFESAVAKLPSKHAVLIAWLLVRGEN
jgi:hypothetical protein